MANSSFKIANYFIKASKEGNVELTPMKLIKLCYIAHGWYLGFYDKPLFDDRVYAWKYGPVINTLYNRFKEYGSGQISDFAYDIFADDDVPMPSGDLDKFLNSIWTYYGQFNAVKLSAMTHQKGTPWYRVWVEEDGKDKKDVIIPNEYIRDHYKEKIKEVQSQRSQKVAK